MKYLKSEQISCALMSVLPAMFRKAGLTMTDISSTRGLFSFRIKEFNRKLLFDYDGFYLEMVVYHNRLFIDYLPVIGVPLVATRDGNYYPEWTAKKHFGAACKSVEQLMKRYLPRQINGWVKKMPAETSIYIYKSKSSGFTRAKVINLLHPPFAEDQKYYGGKIRLWA